MTRRSFLVRRGLVLTAAALVQVLVFVPAWAAGSNMPWEQPLNQILQSVEGPVAKILAVIIIIVTGLTLAFGDTSGGFRRLIQIVFGRSIAFAASSFFLSFFSFSGGAAGPMTAIVDPDVPGFFAPVHRALTDPIPDGRGAADRGDRQRHARGGDRPRPPALDPWRADLG